MKKKKESFILGGILKKIAPSIGATVLLEPAWRIAGQITFKNGKRSYFRFNTLDLNPVGASDIAKDKDYATFFMQSMGYRVIPNSKVFYSKAWADTIGAINEGIDAAYEHAKKIGFPVIVKPNSGSRGSGVSLVHTKKDFYQAVQKIFKSDPIVLVQSYIPGDDYRIVVLDNEVISAYKRTPLSITGDSVSTIAQLLEKKKKAFEKSGRDTNLHTDDIRISQKLKRAHLTKNSVLDKGQTIELLDNANLSTGGGSLDVTALLHNSFKKMAIELTKDMGLRLCGVDILVQGNIAHEQAENYWIIEINAAPGLDHYAKTGAEQALIVEQLYTNVLKHLAR
jgi:D-alanine-D-alanine ligase-like ATP-grasp enzyme